jgi:hypothetical protein
LQAGGFFLEEEEDEDTAVPPPLEEVDAPVPFVWKTTFTAGLSGLGICPGSMREVLRRMDEPEPVLLNDVDRCNP